MAKKNHYQGKNWVKQIKEYEALGFTVSFYDSRDAEHINYKEYRHDESYNSVFQDFFQRENGRAVFTSNEATYFVFCKRKSVFLRLELPTLGFINKSSGEYFYLLKDFSRIVNSKLNTDVNTCNSQLGLRDDSTFDICYGKGVFELTLAGLNCEIINKDKYRIETLPDLTAQMHDKLLKIEAEEKANAGVHYQINEKKYYHIPHSIIKELEVVKYEHTLSLNDLKVFERILLMVGNSTFMLDMTGFNKPFKIDFKAFTRDLHLARHNESIKELIKNACYNLEYYGYIDSIPTFVEKENPKTKRIQYDSILFNCSRLCNEIKHQNTKRYAGFYDNLPNKRNVSVICAFLEHLFAIDSYTSMGKFLKISLKTLLDRLGYESWYVEKRLSRIANLLTELSNAGHVKGFLKDAHTFTVEEVKLLLNRDDNLFNYMKIKNDNSEKKKKS